MTFPLALTNFNFAAQFFLYRSASDGFYYESELKVALLPVKGAFDDTTHFRNQFFFRNVKVLLIFDESPLLSHEVSVCEIEGGTPLSLSLALNRLRSLDSWYEGDIVTNLHIVTVTSLPLQTNHRRSILKDWFVAACSRELKQHLSYMRTEWGQNCSHQHGAVPHLTAGGRQNLTNE